MMSRNPSADGKATASSKISEPSRDASGVVQTHDSTPSATEKEANSSKPTGAGLNGTITVCLQVISGFFLFMNSWGLVNTFGVFQEYYSRIVLSNESNSKISWIGSIEAFLLCFATLFAGPLFDVGHGRTLVLAGSFLTVFGLMMTSLCRAYWQLVLAQGICIGLGSGANFLASVAVIPPYFPNRRALAIGIAAAGSSVGGVAYPIAFHYLVGEVGFAWSTRILGFIALATLIIPISCLRPRTSATRRKIVDLSGFREPEFVLFSIASFAGFSGLYIPFFYITEFASEVAGFSSTLAFYMLPILSAGSIVGRILPGLFADHFGPLNVLTISTLIAGLLAFCWIRIRSSVPGLIIWALLYGAFSGAFVSLQPACVAGITRDMSTIGGRMGTNTFFAALGILVGTPAAGAITGQARSWPGMQAFCGAFLVLSGVLVFYTRIKWAGVSMSKKA